MHSIDSIKPSLPFSISWELIRNGAGGNSRFQAAFTLTSKHLIPSSGWTLYYNQIVGAPDPETVSEGITIEHISGDFYKLFPNDKFVPMAENESLKITYEGKNWVIKKSDSPCGLYLVFDEKPDEPLLIEDYTIMPFVREEQIHRNDKDIFPIPTPEFRLAESQKLSQLKKEELPPLIPTPARYESTGQQIVLDHLYIISMGDKTEKEARVLKKLLGMVMTHPLSLASGGIDYDKCIYLRIQKSDSPESYSLEINEHGIFLYAGGHPGLFYAIQSLMGLVSPADFAQPKKEIILPTCIIEDAPRFPYRGMHLDVARNFLPKSAVLKLLDLMAFYKLNTFHFHLTDDEGWRLEIKKFPELTSVGATRGHTLDEKERLRPAYGSGPFTDSPGTGFFSREDFIEILQYATERHIAVIPEIDMPGHARAAIKAMAAYQERMESEGDFQTDYRLHDPEDASVYRSVQGYDDNVVCVCRESVYRFLEEIVAEVISIYEEANAPISILHIGGDEVPVGVWGNSPVCIEFQKENPKVDNLFQYFAKRFQKILSQYGLTTGGWEEIALTKSLYGETENAAPNPEFLDKNILPYTWNSIIGWGGEDLAYRLANAGFPVVLCNASNLYFDCANDKDPDDPGLYWPGFVDAKKPFELVPFDLFQSARMDRFGNSLDPDTLKKGKSVLTDAGKRRIMGIQGQLWSETVKSSEMMESYIFPKLLSLAERAWAKQPEWATEEDSDLRFAKMDADWNLFLNRLKQIEFPRLNHLFGGVNYKGRRSESPPERPSPS